MSSDIRIERVNQDVQTYRVGLPEGGWFTLEYAKLKSSNPKRETLRMEFPGSVWEKLGEVCRVDGSGIHTTPSIEKRYNELSEEVRNAIAKEISPEARSLLQMI